MTSPISRRKQRAFGAFMATLSLGFIIWSWNTALTRGYFYPKAVFIFTAIAVIGLALMAVPGYKEERLARGEDISEVRGYRLITPRWWAILILAITASLFNFWLIR